MGGVGGWGCWMVVRCSAHTANGYHHHGIFLSNLYYFHTYENDLHKVLKLASAYIVTTISAHRDRHAEVKELLWFHEGQVLCRLQTF